MSCSSTTRRGLPCSTTKPGSRRIPNRCVHGERGCTLCTRACPRFRLWELDADRELYGRARTADEVAGIYHDVFLVEATSKQIAEVGQDGGFGTALLYYAMSRATSTARSSATTTRTGAPARASPRPSTS